MRTLWTEFLFRTSWKLRAAADMCATGGVEDLPIRTDWPAAHVNTGIVGGKKKRRRARRVARPVEPLPIDSDPYTEEYDRAVAGLPKVEINTGRWWELKTPLVEDQPASDAWGEVRNEGKFKEQLARTILREKDKIPSSVLWPQMTAEEFMEIKKVAEEQGCTMEQVGALQNELQVVMTTNQLLAMPEPISSETRRIHGLA